MAFDFDPFSHLDMDFNGLVDESDLQMYELNNGNTFSLIDLNHDSFMDQYQMDLNNDLQIDSYQVDLNHNDIIDKYEFNHMGTSFNYDLNHDGRVDELDSALATAIFPK
jgi:hypothetical protein